MLTFLTFPVIEVRADGGQGGMLAIPILTPGDGCVRPNRPRPSLNSIGTRIAPGNGVAS